MRPVESRDSLGLLSAHAYEVGRGHRTRRATSARVRDCGHDRQLSGGLTDAVQPRSEAIGDLRGDLPVWSNRRADGFTSTPLARAPIRSPVALGALRFDRRADGALVVPKVTVIVGADGRGIGRRRRLQGPSQRACQRPSPGSSRAAETSKRRAPPDEFRLASARPHQDFLDRVSATLARSRAGASTRSSLPVR